MRNRGSALPRSGANRLVYVSVNEDVIKGSHDTGCRVAKVIQRRQTLVCGQSPHVQGRFPIRASDVMHSRSAIGERTRRQSMPVAMMVASKRTRELAPLRSRTNTRTRA
jgi:hypothetical protein